jgi:hypothetical protein
MNERKNLEPNPEEKTKQQEQEDAELLADYLARHSEPIISPENQREAGSKIAELETMIASFESTHSLIELHAIVDLSPDLATLFKYADDFASPQRIADAIKTYEKYNPGYVEVYNKKIVAVKTIVLTSEDTEIYNKRISAKRDLIPIVAMLGTLKNEELKAKCKHLMKAVGSIISDKVNHE